MTTKQDISNEFKRVVTGLNQYGTPMGDEMLERSRPSLWNTPMWDKVDERAGGVMSGEAQLLYGLVRALQPEVILDVGTSHGYSALHLAAGCRDNNIGMVYTVEIHKGRQKMAVGNITNAGLQNFITFTAAIPTLKKVDLILLDAGHSPEDVIGYLSEITGIHDETVILIHDAQYKDNAKKAAQAAGFPFVIINTSYMGLAILAKEKRQ